MGKLFKDYLRGNIYTCVECDTHLAKSSDIVSKSFHGKTGPAFLISKAVNYIRGPLQDTILLTGLHTIMNIYCTQCNATLGWEYKEAFEEDQKFKEGMVVLEKALISKVKGA